MCATTIYYYHPYHYQTDVTDVALGASGLWFHGQQQASEVRTYQLTTGRTSIC